MKFNTTLWAIFANLVLVVYSTLPHGSSLAERINNLQIQREGVAYKVKFSSFNEEYNLKLKKQESSILTSNFQFSLADMDENGNTVFTDVSPNFKSVNSNLYTDANSNAVLRIDADGDKLKLSGVVDGISISHSAEGDHHIATKHYSAPTENLKLDYIDLHRNLTWPSDRNPETQATGIAELYLVVDYKKYQETFGGDINALADYLTVFFHAVNNRYATSNDPGMSFRVSGAVTFPSRAAQAFIENAKIPGSNSYNSGEVLTGFGQWMFANMNTSPAHDLAVLITEEDMNGVGGLAWMNSACWVVEGMSYATSLNVDQGRAWRGVFVVAHEIGHNLGAPHDGDDGEGRGCPGEDGFLMGDTSRPNNNKYYMSECTRRTINNFIQSDGARCLQSFQAGGHWNLGNDDPGNRMDMTGQCKIWTGQQTATVLPDRDPNELCKNLMCWWPDVSGDFMWLITMNLPPGDNSPCGNGGRCWLGNCI